MNLKQWAAFASAMLGKPVTLEVPSAAEVKKYG
jgi:hypothetical protein